MIHLQKLTARKSKSRRQVAFVMSGGGPLGAIQAGYLHALLEADIVPDVVIGCSVGAINAVGIAQEPTVAGAERLREIWLRMRSDDLFPGGRLVTAWHVVRKGSFVYTNIGMRRILESELQVSDFEDLKVPAHILATNVETGSEAWFSQGPMVEPLLASSAMPGVFPPVTINGVTYMDGGVSNNIPVAKALDLGASKIFVLNASGAGQKRQLHRPHDFAMRGFVLARSQKYRQDLERCRASAEVVELPMVEAGHVPFTNMSQSARLIAAGYRVAGEFLAGQGSKVYSRAD